MPLPHQQHTMAADERILDVKHRNKWQTTGTERVHHATEAEQAEASANPPLFSDCKFFMITFGDSPWQDTMKRWARVHTREGSITLHWPADRFARRQLGRPLRCFVCINLSIIQTITVKDCHNRPILPLISGELRISRQTWIVALC
jgi:cytochrome c-type biogenesis protein CcmH/NrfF